MKQGVVAIATLLYSPDYLPGVFTLITQLNKLLSGKPTLTNVETVLFVTPEIYNEALTDFSRNILQNSFKQIIQIDPLKSQESAEETNRRNLKLLQRPELSFALIKARLWEHIEFDQILYLDADTLPLNDTLFNVFELTTNQTKYQVGAAPDVGWPDLFNSGVMTIVPDAEIAVELQDFILRETSIDGADQGILNQFFNPKCGMTQTNSWLVLPFLYNVTTPNDGYQSTPAMLYFKDQIKLIHFIGKTKPWKAWTRKDFVSNKYSNLWQVIYDDFAQSNGIVQCYTSNEPGDDQSHQEEYNSGESDQKHLEQHHHEEQSNRQDISSHNIEETHTNEYQNLKSYVCPEAIEKMEEEKLEQEQHLNEIEEKPPTPVQLPLDFKEWLTTFIEKENVQEIQSEPEANIEHLVLNSDTDNEENHVNEEPHQEEILSNHENHEITNCQQEPIVDVEDAVTYINEENGNHQDDESLLQQEEPQEEQDQTIESVPNYKFDWEDTNYLQKVERVFPDDIFAYETKEEKPRKSEIAKEESSNLGVAENSGTSEPVTTLNNETDSIEVDSVNYDIEEKEGKLDKTTLKVPHENKEEERLKTVREKLEELTASIDFGLQDYIDIGTVSDDDDEEDESKKSKKECCF